MSSTDIRKFSVAETAVLTLLDPSENPMIGDDNKPMTITMYGPGSKQYAQAQAAQNNRLLERMKKRGGGGDISAEQRIREQAEFLAGCTKDFSANIKYDSLEGEALFKAVYGDQKVGFIAEQASKFAGDWANFYTPSTTT